MSVPCVQALLKESNYLWGDGFEMILYKEGVRGQPQSFYSEQIMAIRRLRNRAQCRMACGGEEGSRQGLERGRQIFQGWPTCRRSVENR